MNDVVVVGAGVAGLGCARALTRAGVDVVVLEARDRIGGRVWTAHDLDDGPVELGALFVHGERASIVEVAREAGLTLRAPQGMSGFGRVMVDGQVREAREFWLEAGLQLWDAEQAVARMDGGDRPLRDALVDHGWPPQRRLVVEELFRQVWCADPAVLSAEGARRVEEAWSSGRANLVVAEGYDAVVTHLAQGLRVELGRPACLVQWERGRATVESGGPRFEARAVVVTVPPSVAAAGGLRFSPLLPPPKAAAATAIPVGPALRVVARLRAPAVATETCVVFGERGGFWRVTAGSPLVIGWVGGPAAATLAGIAPEDLLRAVRPAFVETDVLDVERVRHVDWGHDPWALGAYSYPRAGALDAPAAWAAPVDDILFFAGEATCGDLHPATVHGAYDSGLRAATEVLETLGR